MATIVTPHHRPQMATVRPQIMKARPADTNRTGEILDYPFEPGAWALTRILNREPNTQKQVNLDQADIIVAGGRGAGGPEGLQLLQELAATLGGTLAVSRAPVEEGWIASDYQVGQTGKTVAPGFICLRYFRHYSTPGRNTGCRYRSCHNRDAKAPIFQAADYGLVGDLFEIVPLLITKIKEIQINDSSIIKSQKHRNYALSPCHFL